MKIVRAVSLVVLFLLPSLASAQAPDPVAGGALP